MPLNVHVPAAGTYTLNAASLLNFASATTGAAARCRNRRRINLRSSLRYSFTAASYRAAGPLQPVFWPAPARWPPPMPRWPQQVQLFPNPAHGSFTLVLPAELGRSR